MNDITAIFVVASAVVALLLVSCITGLVIFARSNDAPPDPDLNQILRRLDDREVGK
ncbi:hypothetical protein [Paraburkholderia sp. UYCP14C]|uniref:hypothetical protein n=1 Tax=Paraburkholderia sp. UYCP14C TaxID=2511130 RepID=UPI00145A0161|nr:hypothetical protein [Paraburkholderia sp. UYCP14C]